MWEKSSLSTSGFKYNHATVFKLWVAPPKIFSGLKPIGIEFNGIACILDILLDCSQSLFFHKSFGIDHLPLQATTMASNVRI